ncbi:MAG: glutathione S-transferase N-terminal domain-containing protein, partial [Gammaproteobacteria bacterium]|nr:glutathione S-transferase N-terminal domain-containing protein [Gammaproteobacteria bacterium]
MPNEALRIHHGAESPAGTDIPRREGCRDRHGPGPSGENLGPEFRAINPRSLLPTLVLDDGTVIDESVAICRYIEELHPEPPLMGTDAKSKAVIESAQRHMEWDGLLSVAEAFRNSNPTFADRGISGSEGVPA